MLASTDLQQQQHNGTEHGWGGAGKGRRTEFAPPGRQNAARRRDPSLPPPAAGPDAAGDGQSAANRAPASQNLAAPAPQRCRPASHRPRRRKPPPVAAAAVGGRRTSHPRQPPPNRPWPGQPAPLGMCSWPRATAEVSTPCDRNHQSAHPQGSPKTAKRHKEASAHSHGKQQQHKQSELALCVAGRPKRQDRLTKVDLLPSKAHQQLRQSTQPSGGAASPSAAPLLGVSPSWPRLQPNSAPACRTSKRVKAPGGKPQCARTSFKKCTNGLTLTQCGWVPKAPPNATG